MSTADTKALAAELIGTFWLVLGGCGAAVLAGAAIGTHGISLAFGLTVLTGAYALGHISGGHFNPAVTVGLIVGGRFSPTKAVGYIVAQLVGAVLAALVIFGVASGKDGFEIGDGPGAFASNGYGDFSPDGYGLGSAFLVEVVLTAVFLLVILGATAKRATAAAGGLAIGLALTLIHLVSIPVTNTSVNPARSTSQAIFAGGDQLGQLWLFWVAPIVGGALGAALHRYVVGDPDDVLPPEQLANA